MFLETQLKEALQNALSKHDELDTTTLLNVVNDVLKTVGVLFDQTVKTMWDGMQANKEGLDLAQKLSVILTGLLDVDEDATADNIVDVCSKLVPIAGTMLNSHVTDMWKEKCELDDAVLADLSPAIIDHESNARHTKDYTEIFHVSSLHNAQETYDKLRSLYENSYKMSSVFHDMHDELSKQLVLFLSEWSIYKTASKEAANRLEAEREHIKAQYDQKVSNLGKELSKGTILLERTMEKLKVAEVKIKELKAVEALYNTLENKHADLLIDYELNKKTLTDMQVDYSLIKEEQKLYHTTMKELQESVCMAHEEGIKFQYHYIATSLEKYGVEKALEMKEQECRQLQV
ncbi:hypothetical protein EON65_23250 [archaeon]|nr:MAG: hypothetical protein EON65_23250 [archaeon]